MSTETRSPTPPPDSKRTVSVPGPGRSHDAQHTRRVELEARPDSRAALESWISSAGTLHEAAASHPGAETLEGRGRVYSVPAPVGSGRWVVRHYQRGGAVASLLGDRYVRLGTPRPVRELEVGRALEGMGVPTPRHVGCAVYPAGLWYRGDLVTELVPHSRDLAAVLFGTDPGGEANGEAEAAMRAAGSLVRTLHERGVVHRDLNLKNVLIAGREGGVRALILDLDRATLRARVGERARRRMLERFWRSARKWEKGTGRRLEPGVRRSFGEGYGPGPPFRFPFGPR